MDEIGFGSGELHEQADRAFGGCGDPACPTGNLVLNDESPASVPEPPGHQPLPLRLLPDPEDEPIWCRIELAEVAATVDEYELWKDDAWYHEVDWAAVSDVLDRLIQANAVDGVVTDLVSRVDDALGDLQTVDAEGLVALMGEPITVTRAQLTNGGHRLKAMLRQGVITVPGMFVRSDVGNSVSAGRVYPLSAEADATT